ncbi:hypothetical protein [Deinococcus sp. PEB2-63]
MFRAAMRLDGLGQAMLSGQPVALSGLALTEMAAVLYAAATEIRELYAQVEATAGVNRGVRADWIMLAWLGHVDREQVLYKHLSSDPYEVARTLRQPALDIEEAKLRASRTELTSLSKGWVGDWRQIVLTSAGRQRLTTLRADFAAALAQAGGES